jgi:hypothetical protein
MTRIIEKIHVDPKQDPAPAFSKSFGSGSNFEAQASKGHMLQKNVKTSRIFVTKTILSVLFMRKNHKI